MLGPRELTALIRLHPEYAGPSTIWRLRQVGDAFGRNGEWAEAAPLFGRAYQVTPTDHGLVLAAAATALASDNQDTYRGVVNQALKQFSETDDPLAADRTAKAGLLVARSGEELAQLTRLAQVAVERGDERWRHYFQMVRGMAAYRSGDMSGTLDWCGRSRVQAKGFGPVEALDLLFEAMAHHHLNQTDQAHSAMTRATKLIDDHHAQVNNDLGGDWCDWLICQIVRREAEQQITKK
jgi:hypothetical protein